MRRPEHSRSQHRDPSQPDRLYVGLNEYVGSFQDRLRIASRVKTSQDGGQTWMDLGQQDPGAIVDLALGIDGQNLYLATDQGLWRLSLSPQPAP
jgi:hypothetical protein